jgi:ribosomal protein L11 methyltransferase
VTFETEDAITNFLFELGAVGCYDREDVLYAYFLKSDWGKGKKDRIRLYLHQLAELHFPVQLDKVQIKEIENQDWNAQWKQSLKPIEIGDKIVIKPSWINLKSSSSKKIIEIDPQMAFGTGVHDTTQLMLKLLVDHVGNPARIMDIGTGTGVLAIAAAKFSNAMVLAFDNDPVATSTAQENCIKNKVSDRIHIFCGTIDAVKNVPFDLILANINRTIIIESLSKIFRCLSHTGMAIFSGILIEEKKQVVEFVEKLGFKIVKELEQGEWAGLVVSG